MKLLLKDIEVECVIGDRPDERNRRQRLLVEVEIEVSGEAASSDCLEDTVDYAALAEKIRAALVAAECRMIERAAKIAYCVCLAERGVRRAVAKVSKSRAAEGIGAAVAVYPG